MQRSLIHSGYLTFVVALAISGCDPIGLSAMNDGIDTVSVEFHFKANAQCQSFGPIAIGPSKFTITRCGPAEIYSIEFIDRGGSCTMDGATIRKIARGTSSGVPTIRRSSCK